MKTRSKHLICMDLDGPVLNVSEKYFQVYQSILREKQQNVLEKNEYWQLKREKVPDVDIFKRSNAVLDVSEYHRIRKSQIEQDGAQVHDLLKPLVSETLKKIRENGYLIALVTLRNSRSQLEKQLKRLNVYSYFDTILSSGVETDQKWKVKSDMVRGYCKNNSLEPVLFIGDTETDIKAGKDLSIPTVAISNGIRTSKLLEDQNPDQIIEELFQLNLQIARLCA